MTLRHGGGGPDRNAPASGDLDGDLTTGGIATRAALTGSGVEQAAAGVTDVSPDVGTHGGGGTGHAGAPSTCNVYAPIEP